MNEKMTKELIRDVKTKDRTKAIETLVLAFASDPQLRFLYPDPLKYQSYAFDFFKAFGGNAFEQDSAHQIDGFSGVALWLPPDTHPNEEDLVNPDTKVKISSTCTTWKYPLCNPLAKDIPVDKSAC